jgi:hypothetical protein
VIVGALLYYQRHSWANRLVTRVRRLRQPKYLFGAVVGGLYLYWYFFRAFFGGRPGMVTIWSPNPENTQLVHSIASLILFLLIAGTWIFPQSRAALNFTEAEVAFLFPAPVGRKTLVHFKLLKSQISILISALFMTLISRRWGPGNPLIRGLGWWIILATMNFNGLGCSFTRTMLMDRGISTWARRLSVLAIVGALAAGTFAWLYCTLPPPPVPGPKINFAQLGQYAQTVLQSGPLPYILLPFHWIVAPYFATSAGQFLMAIGPALAVIVLLYWWVIHLDVAFEEASVELSQKTAEKMAAIRSGNWQSAQKPKKAARSPFQLRTTGMPAVALIWKNLTSAGGLVTKRFWLMLVWFVFFGGMIMQSQGRHVSGVSVTIAFMALGFAAMSLLWGPQMLRNDLRQDLPAADMLKMLPIPGWQVVLGEVLAPVVILAAVQWLLLLVALLLFPNHLDKFSSTLFDRVAYVLAAAIVAPCVDFIALLIPNAAVLFLPAWFQLGQDAPRGFETTGQRLILMFGQLLVLVLSLVPATVIFGVVFFLASRVMPLPMSILAASPFAASCLLLEGSVGVWLLGAVFERFDLSSEDLRES